MLSTAIHTAENERRQPSRVWTEIFQSLTGERGVWSLGREPSVHWKLDKVESSSRMRRKLVVNHEFHDHKDASAKRDRDKRATKDEASHTIPKNVVRQMNDFGKNFYFFKKKKKKKKK